MSYSAAHNRRRSRLGASLHTLLVSVASSALVLSTVQSAYADPVLPSGGVVTHGEATISATGNGLLINQTSTTGILAWDSFSVGSGSSVHFANGNGATLNRVIGNTPSQIDGSLTATGSLYLINQHGIAVGNNGMVATGGSFVASTQDVANADFLDGDDMVFSGTSAAGIVNLGTIRSADGDVALIARQVDNQGTVSADNGTAALLAGYEVLALAETGDAGKYFVRLGGSGTGVTTSGALEAAQVELRANGGSVAALAGNTQAVAKATGAQSKGGRIFLTAEGGSVTVEKPATFKARKPQASGAAGGEISVTADVVSVGGLLDASGSAVTGGAIKLAGDLIFNTGTLDASGPQGGNIELSGRSIANAGQVAVSGNSGEGGRYVATASGSYIETAAGSVDANGSSGGSIRIDAANVFSSGRLTATGSTGRGGDIILTAPTISLVAATLDSSGHAGGGTIRVGGDYQGGGTLSHAESVTISPATRLLADAVSTGNGGSIVVWSTGQTDYYGHASAVGGSASGNGGLIELSSTGLLTMGGMADASSANGIAGTVLLDPMNIVIDDVTGKYPQYQLIDPNPNDLNQFGAHVVALANGNVVVTSYLDDFGATEAGAVYLFDGNTGALLSTLTGSSFYDLVGVGGITALSNGNYVVGSYSWDNGFTTDAGAVTWGNGATGTSGAVSASNSLVGTTAGDLVGRGGITALSNGNYVVGSYNWDNGSAIDAGAVTWGNGATGTSGGVSASNSLVGTTSGDRVGVGGVTALSNGNYVVSSYDWDNGSNEDAGAVTWGNGAIGTSGVVSASNSLVGTTSGHWVGVGGVTALNNGNYVVSSYDWDNGSIQNAGAVTWGNGATGTTGAVSASNSLVGTMANDQVGIGGITALSNGNYVVNSYLWTNGWVWAAGAVTWGNGAIGTTGAVSASNSLVGTTSGDQVGIGGITALSNGNYVVNSYFWTNGPFWGAGAVTWGDGTVGTTGEVSASNSLVGTTQDYVGIGGITALSNGNYVVNSYYWNNGFVGSAGAATWGNGAIGTSGAVSASNSLVGTSAFDFVGMGGITALSNGNYVVSSYRWRNESAAQAGAVTWGNGTTGTSGAVSASNSLFGTMTYDQVGIGGITALSNGNYVVSNWIRDNGAAVNAVTWGDGATGTIGTVSASNSLIGTTANAQLVYAGVLEGGSAFIARSAFDGGSGRVYIGLTDINAHTGGLTYAHAQSQTVTITPAALTAILNTGSDLRLEASNDITVNSAIFVDNPGGNGGDLSLHAGRSIFLNANITTDNGDLELIGNAPGAIGAYRAAGRGSIVFADGVSINAGTGAVSVDLLGGRAAGDISLGVNAQIAASQVRLINQGAEGDNAVILNSGSSIIGASDSEAISIFSDIFHNRSDASAFVLTGGGYFTVHSQSYDAGVFTRGGLGGGNLYNVPLSYPSATPVGLSPASRFIFAQQPTLLITGNPGTATYDGSEHYVGGVSADGLVNGDAIPDAFNGGLTWHAFVNAGHYTSGLLTGGVSDMGYKVVIVDQGSLTITPADLLVTALPQSKVQGNPDPVLDYVVVGLVNGDTVSGALVRDPGEAPGTYAIRQGTLGASANYLLSFVTAGLVIVAANDNGGGAGLPGIVPPTFPIVRGMLPTNDSGSPDTWRCQLDVLGEDCKFEPHPANQDVLLAFQQAS